jgi:hypothetical protein
MSHFTVLVPAKDEEELDVVLLPYHEYECTGIEAYTEFVPADMDELMADYEEHGDGRDLEAFAEDWNGYVKNDEGVFGHVTNPNAKWDWWLVGGRWSGMLLLKPAPMLRGKVEVAGLDRNEVDFLVGLYKDNGGKFERTVAKYKGKADEIRRAVVQIAEGGDEAHPEGELGTPGIFGRPYNDLNGRADTALVQAIDWDAMLQEQHDNRAKAWDNWAAALAIAGKTPEWYLEDFEPRWKAARDARDNDAREALREEWQLIRSAVWDAADEDEGRKDLVWSMDFKPRGGTRQEHIEADRALTYAFIDLEGNWNQRGRMGWWGISDESEGTLDYDDVFWRFVRSLSPEQRVYVVDCHI